MIADITVTEKSFGPKNLMHGVKFSIDAAEKVGVVGRNGVGKSTLFGILAGTDKDFTGEVIYRRGTTVVATSQEHHGLHGQTVLQYVLAGLPEYAELSQVIETYPLTMGDDMTKINTYTDALQRFDDKGFYTIEEQIERELDNFQLPRGAAHRPFATLSGGQKRLIEIVKVMHSDAHLALIDEPTNHMDYVAKAQFIEWMQGAREAMLVITHDRDVLSEVDRIIELKDGENVSYKGNYDAYLKQNAVSTGAQMNDFEMVEKRIANLKVKVLDYQRLKEKSRNPGTIQKFKRLEEVSRKELAELQAKEKPTFWIDKESAANLNYKVAAQYDKFKAKNIRMNLKDDASRSKHVLVNVKNLSLGYGDNPLFSGVNIDLRESEALEIRGRNGAGKTTLIKALLGNTEPSPLVPAKPSSTPFPTPTSISHQTHQRRVISASASLSSAELALLKQSSPSQETDAEMTGLAHNGVSLEDESGSTALSTSITQSSYSLAAIHKYLQPEREPTSGPDLTPGAKPFVNSSKRNGEQDGRILKFAGDITLDQHVRIGIYEQEVSPTYFDLPLEEAIERMYLDRGLSISTTKIRSLLSDYLFTESDRRTPLSRLSGGQKARFQLIAMLANDPQLLILDEPTNHLDLPSIEELEMALAKYTGAVLYVSHDGYFCRTLGGEVVEVGNKL